MLSNVRHERWGLRSSHSGELMVENHGVLSLAKRYGTPLHIMNERRLIATAKHFVDKVTSAYSANVSVHYALKCNSVPAIVDSIRSAGLNAEVMTEYELDLAINLGYAGKQIIANGPCKTLAFLAKCIKNNVRLIIVDSLQELDDIEQIARAKEVKADILLRVNPDYKPRSLNKGTSTGSRRCAFGFDIKCGELRSALSRLQSLNSLNFLGLHMHRLSTSVFQFASSMSAVDLHQ
jgi:diaminopimelate decarboxylase